MRHNESACNGTYGVFDGGFNKIEKEQTAFHRNCGNTEAIQPKKYKLFMFLISGPKENYKFQCF